MTQGRYRTPGVYRQDVFLEPVADLRTGVPAFVGLVRKAEVDNQAGQVSLQPLPSAGLWLVRKYDPDRGAIWAPPAGAYSQAPEELTLWPQFVERFGALASYGYLAAAVRGFFANEGRLCYVQLVCYAADAAAALDAGLATLGPLDTIDLVCAPDIMRPPLAGGAPTATDVQVLQTKLLDHCGAHGDRFAILDALPGAAVDEVIRQRDGLNSANAALYYPWVRVADDGAPGGAFIPPSGHVAGVYARSDARVGVHKAPANETLEGVLDLEVGLTAREQDRLNPSGVNCLRSFPGRGIRVWGARTLSRDPNWTYVNVRRLFLTAGRWVQRNMADTVFEPNDPRLWTRIGRELSTYFTGLFQRGALRGNTPQEAFYVKCDAATNPPEVRAAGQVVTEIGLAPGLPGEFVVVRIILAAGGVSIVGPALPG
ncbi:MAG TPA: phage tail sheath subtilisin-like domain-containing protein [Roseiflexaceae bacterium]